MFDPAINAFRVRRLPNGRDAVDAIETERQQIEIADRAIESFHSHSLECRNGMTASYRMTADKKFRLFLSFDGGEPKESGDIWQHPEGAPDADYLRIYLENWIYGNSDDPVYGCACEG